MKVIKTLCFFWQILFLSACSDLFEYSPYDTDIKTHDLNTSESIRISNKISSSTDTLKFAFFSDIHEHYDDLSDAISSINKENGLQFAVCCGDITNAGLKQEYKWYFDIAEKSVIPLVTVIGNHDYLSNGYHVYTRLFGPSKISFIAGKYKFILFDNIIWEKNNQMPDYKWLSGELSDTGYYNVLLTHIPPFSEEMVGDFNLAYRETVDSINTMLCLHGHIHRFVETTFNGIPTIISANIDKREYYIIKLIGDKSIVKRIKF